MPGKGIDITTVRAGSVVDATGFWWILHGMSSDSASIETLAGSSNIFRPQDTVLYKLFSLYILLAGVGFLVLTHYVPALTEAGLIWGVLGSPLATLLVIGIQIFRRPRCSPLAFCAVLAGILGIGFASLIFVGGIISAA